jgi:hypothetical protein
MDVQIVTCRGSVSRKVCNTLPDVVEVREKEECSEGPRNVTIYWSVAEGCIPKSAGLKGFGKTHQSTSSLCTSRR